MKLKKIILVFLIGISYLVLLAGNYVFFSAYINAYMVSKYGERVDVEIVELLHGSGGGYKGYTYRVKRDGQLSEKFIKSKLDMDETVSVILSPTDQGRMFLLEGEGNIVSVFNGITGSWLMSSLFIFLHILILKISWQVFVKLPLEAFQKNQKAS